MQLPPDAPPPRLCIVEKLPGETEYGYNLHAEKSRGQFVGIVDAGSAAERGGLQQGDRIFAVNGHSIVNENHKKVVERIKQNSQRCELLVISEDGAKWYAENGIAITPDLPNVVRINERGHRESAVHDSPPPNGSWYAPAKTEPVFVPPPPPTTMKPLPLLAKLEKTSPNDEFGFNLHAEKGRGHFIGTVDAGGIGERAGLRMGQRIVGVNDTLVYPTTPHKEVVALIKISPLLTTLLVASEDVDHWHRHNDVPYSFDEADGLPQQKSRSTTIAGQQLNPHSIQVGGDAETIMHHQNAEQKDEHVTENHGSHEPDVYNAYAPVAETSDEDLLDQVFSEVALPTTHVMGGPRSATGTSLSSHRESAVDVPTSHYMPTHVHDQHSPQYGGQSSPLSNGSSGYNAFSATNADDIYHLPAKDARERLRNRNRKFKGHDMSLNEKYEVVSNM